MSFINRELTAREGPDFHGTIFRASEHRVLVSTKAGRHIYNITVEHSVVNRQTDGMDRKTDRQVSRQANEERLTDRHSPHDDMPFFGKRKTDVIVPVCPPMLLISRPVSASHNLSMVSRLRRRPIMTSVK